MEKRILAALAFLSLLAATGCTKTGNPSGGSVNLSSVGTAVPTATPTTVNSACPTPLTGSMAMIYPTVGSYLGVGAQVVWQVMASGCTGRYRVSTMPGATPFTSILDVSKSYLTAGAQTDTFTLYSVDANGNTIGTITVTSASFTVGSVVTVPPPGSNPTPTPVPGSGYAVPICEILRVNSVTSSTQSVNVVMNTLGAVSLATIGGVSVVPGVPYTLPAQSSNRYTVYGTVSGPGGSSTCSLQFALPTCSLAAANVTSQSVQLTITLHGEIDGATIDGTNISPFPVPPTNTFTRTEALSTSGVSRTSYGMVYSPEGDQASCSTTYSVPSNMQITQGLDSACGTKDGAVYCWGYNGYGELGDGNTQNSTSPVSVSGLTSGVSKVAGGGYHQCAIQNGAAVCWGYNGYGQLGNGTTTEYQAPVGVHNLTSNVSDIAGGLYHTCAIQSGGVFCWGYNAHGELGNGAYGNSSVPVGVSGLSAGATAVAAGDYHTCAVVYGQVWCWGYNGVGELGNGTTTGSSVPVKVSGMSSATAVAAGQYQSCAVNSGAAYCWGYNSNGQLGNGSTVNSSAPSMVSGLSSGVTAVSQARYHGCAIQNGAALCWGYNAYGQLGNGTTAQSTAPVQVSGMTSGVTSIATNGYLSSCAARNGKFYCWGYNGYGELGNGTYTTSSSPIEVSGF